MPDTPPPAEDLPQAEALAQPTSEAAAPAPADLSPAACGARLAELFPALFGKGRPLPLKLRIQADIQQRAPGIFTKKSLSAFLHRHTTSTAYLIALTHAPQRFDLAGAAAGELAAEHRQAAADELGRRRALHEERRAAEQAALQRERNAEIEAHRERAALLRAFEGSTLTRANFCALKGIAEADLEARLALAREERELRPPRADQRPDQRPDPRPEPRVDSRRPQQPREDDRGRRPRRPGTPGAANR
jgi:sRNA-binding protein